MNLKKRIDDFTKNQFIKIECTPEMTSYLSLKVITNYLRSKYIRYEYVITITPTNDINIIYINFNNKILSEECFNLRNEECKTCILKEFTKFINCKFEFMTLFDYFSKLINKSNLLCKECTSLYEEIFLLEKKEEYPIYLFHNNSSLYLSLYHDISFIKKYFKRNMTDSIKYFLAKEGISISDSLQRFNQNAPTKEMYINKISTLEYYFVLLSELMNYTSTNQKVSQEKTNKVLQEKCNRKKDHFLEEDKKSLTNTSDNSISKGMTLYYELIENILEILNSRSLKKGYILLKKEVINDNLVIFMSLYEIFRYFKSDIFFLCENGFVIFHKKLNLKGEFLNDTVMAVEEKEIKRFLFNFNKL